MLVRSWFWSEIIKELEFYEEDIYTLSKKEALKILEENGITGSEQMLLRWCRDGKIDAIRITGRLG